MTEKIFWTDPYLAELTSTVAAVDGAAVELEETIFFAFRGGQERDHGTIADREVLDAEWIGPRIVYRLDPHHGVTPGDTVDVKIDPDRRDRLRRLHMATEIVLVLMTRADAHLVKVGAHISPGKGRIDFAAAEPITPLLPNVSAAANSIISADLPIARAFEDDSERRYWEIDGLARVPCGGTLPDRTGEIGPIELRRSNPGKGKERVEITFASTG